MTVNPELKAGLTRHFQRYTGEDRAMLQACPGIGHQQREQIGEYFWTHEAFPDRGFDTRKQAIIAASRALNLPTYTGAGVAPRLPLAETRPRGNLAASNP